MKLARTTAAVVAVLLALVTLVGCGGSNSDLTDLSAKQLLSKARHQVAQAKYVTVKGDLKNGSEKIGLDLSYIGKDSHGTISINGNSMEIESVGGKTYFKPSAGFWKAQMGSSANAVLQVVGGKWILADASNSSFAQLVDLTRRTLISKQMLTPQGKITKGETKTVNGVDCIALDSEKGSLFLDESDARPVQLTGKDSESTGSANFTYDKVAAPTAPSKDQVFDLSQLGQ